MEATQHVLSVSGLEVTATDHSTGASSAAPASASAASSAASAVAAFGSGPGAAHTTTAHAEIKGDGKLAAPASASPADGLHGRRASKQFAIQVSGRPSLLLRSLTDCGLRRTRPFRQRYVGVGSERVIRLRCFLCCAYLVIDLVHTQGLGSPVSILSQGRTVLLYSAGADEPEPTLVFFKQVGSSGALYHGPPSAGLTESPARCLPLAELAEVLGTNEPPLCRA
jgi:hypothetical protein